ncbi:Parafibromin [Manis pentadactyla]|nr:Parafibromin [Manis pentadactyla]
MGCTRHLRCLAASEMVQVFTVSKESPPWDENRGQGTQGSHYNDGFAITEGARSAVKPSDGGGLIPEEDSVGLEKAFAVRTLHPESSPDPTPGELARLSQNQQGGKRGPFIRLGLAYMLPGPIE